LLWGLGSGNGRLERLICYKLQRQAGGLRAAWWPSRCGTAAAKMHSSQTRRSQASSHFTRGPTRRNGSLDCWLRELRGPDKSLRRSGPSYGAVARRGSRCTCPGAPSPSHITPFVVFYRSTRGFFCPFVGAHSFALTASRNSPPWGAARRNRGNPGASAAYPAPPHRRGPCS